MQGGGECRQMMVLYQRYTFFCTLLCTRIEKLAAFSRDSFRLRSLLLAQPARSCPPLETEVRWRSLTDLQGAVDVFAASSPFSNSLSNRLKYRSDSKNCLYLLSPQGNSLLHPPHLAFSACTSFRMNFSTGPSSTSLLSGLRQFLMSYLRWLPSMYRSARGETPVMVSRSAIMLPLILMSRGESEFIEGDMLTSMSQGLRLESISTSKPSTSQQLLLQGTFCRKEVQRMFYPERMVLTIRSSIRANNSPVSSLPTLKLRKSFRALRLHLLPKYSSFSFSLFTNSVFFLFTLQLVRCWKRLFSQSLAFWSQVSVANLPRPSWQMQNRRGLTPRRATQMRRSNLRLLMRRGLPMQWLTIREEYFSSLEMMVEILVVTVMPFPWDRLCGFTMQVIPGERAISSSRRGSSCGRMNVLGRKLKWDMPCLICILEMHLFMRSLRVRWKELGKWLIFWQGSRAWYVSILMMVEDQQSVQFLLVCAHLKPFSSSTFLMSLTAPFWNLQKQPISSCLAMLLISEKFSIPFSTSSSYYYYRYSIPSIYYWIIIPSYKVSRPDHGLNRRNLTAASRSFWSADLSCGIAASILLPGRGRSSLALGLTISMSSSSSQSAYLSFYNIFLYTCQKYKQSLRCSAVEEDVGLGRTHLLPAHLLEGAVREEEPAVAALWEGRVVAAPGRAVVDDHRVELVVVRARVEAVSGEVEQGRRLYFCVVFAQVVVESLEGQDQDAGRVLHVELSHRLLGLAALAGEVVLLAQVLRGEEGVYDAAALLELGVDQALFVDLCPWDFAFWQCDLLVEGLCEGDCHLETEIDAPTDLFAIIAFQSAGQVEPKHLLSDCILTILQHFLSLFLTHPELLAIYQAIEKHSKELLGVLLVHVLVLSLGLADPVEEGLGSEVLLGVLEVFFEDEVDLSHFAVVEVSVKGHCVVEGVQDLCGIEALDGGIEEAGIAQVFEAEDLELFLAWMVQLYLFLFFHFFLLFFLDILLLFLLLDLLLWHQRPFCQPFLHLYTHLQYLSMSILYLLQLVITNFHLFLAIECFREVLLAAEAIERVAVRPEDEGMFGAIAVLIGAFDGFVGEAAGLAAGEADIEEGVVVGLVASASEVAFVEEVGDFLQLQVEQVLANFRHVQQQAIIMEEALWGREGLETCPFYNN